MFTTFLLALATHLAPTALAAPPPEAQIPVVSVKASSALPKWKGYTFDSSNLIDGRVDTSWQPAKSDTLGVGQWVELDLGAHYAISRIEIAQGLQKVDPKLGDLFCRNNRFADGVIWFDDGAYAPIWTPPSVLVDTLDGGFYRGEALPGKEVKTVTRYLRLVINSVHDPVDWKDIAVAEIRVFGRPAQAPPSDPKSLAWDRPGIWPLKTAVADFCAANDQTRRKHGCDRMTRFVTTGEDTSKGLAPVSVEDFEKGLVVASFEGVRVKHRLELQRAADGRWAVKRHTRVDASGKPAPPDSTTPPEPDRQHQNNCWEKLGKTRPDTDDTDDTDGDDDDSGLDDDEAAPE